MANICIRTLNYVTSGKYLKYIDLDIGYDPESWHITELVPEHDKSVVLGEESTGVKVTPEPHADLLYRLYKLHEYMRNYVYATSIEANPYSYKDTKDNKNNLYSLFNLKNNVIVHDLYDLNDICIKSAIKNDDGNIDIYAPDMSANVLGVAQLRNYTYCLTDRKQNTPSYVTTNLINNRDSTKEQIKTTDYVASITNKPILTYLYQLSSQFDEDNISSNYEMHNIVNGIEYNYILELQNNNQYNDFENGDVYGDVFTAKNAYNAQYSMEMNSIVQANSCRDYKGIGICGDQVFLKYSDDVNYSGKKTNDTIDMEKNDTTKFKFQKIETLLSINRFASGTSHRSNMFSLKISNTGLDELDINDKFKVLKKQILLDINNNINELVKNVCPIHTLLFKVEYTD